MTCVVASEKTGNRAVKCCRKGRLPIGNVPPNSPPPKQRLRPWRYIADSVRVTEQVPEHRKKLMSDYPQEVVDVAKQCDLNNTSDINEAVEEWYRKVQAMQGFGDWVESFIKSAGRSIIQDCRHRRNTQMKREAGAYGGPAKVVAGMNTASTYVASLFDYAIDGRRLGDIRWEELESIAADQQMKAMGYTYNFDLCVLLRSKKPQRASIEATIEESFGESSLKKVFNSLA